MSLGAQHKTIKPANVGGVAGGEKYIANGILFKFCVDMLIPVPGGTPVWMYGGHERNDKNAMKAGSLELQGLSNWFAQFIPGLRFPLVALIDYKGYRIIATSMLPVGPHTLRYGSCDGGRTVLASDPVLNRLMDAAAAGMNLKKHFVGNKRVPISGPGDIEGHLGTDGCYYVLDFSRTFPPAAPELDADGNPKEPRAVFYKMLRPELVKTNNVPLSSDAFTGWETFDNERLQNRQDVIEATERILKECVPALITELEALDLNTISDNYFSIWKGGTAKAILKMLAILNLPSRLHARGINVRYLGHIRSRLKSPSWRILITSIAVARLLNDKLREKLRSQVRYKAVSDAACRFEIAEFFNNALFRQLARSETWCPRTLSESEKCFNIREELEAKFPNILNDRDKQKTLSQWLNSTICPRIVICRCM